MRHGSLTRSPLDAPGSSRHDALKISAPLSEPRRARLRVHENALRRAPLNGLPSWEILRFHAPRYASLQHAITDSVLHNAIPNSDVLLTTLHD